MAYDEELAARTREMLAELTADVVEKTMFGGLAFMVNRPTLGSQLLPTALQRGCGVRPRDAPKALAVCRR